MIVSSASKLHPWSHTKFILVTLPLTLITPGRWYSRPNLYQVWWVAAPVLYTWVQVFYLDYLLWHILVYTKTCIILARSSPKPEISCGVEMLIQRTDQVAAAYRWTTRGLVTCPSTIASWFFSFLTWSVSSTISHDHQPHCHPDEVQLHL
jgi:hypothetical protein